MHLPAFSSLVRLLPLLFAAACAAVPEQDARLVLSPKSSAQVEAWGICAHVENKLPKGVTLYVPISTAEGWQAFTSREHQQIRVRPCASSPRS